MKAQLTAWIKDSVKVDDEAVATINTLGFMGEKYMEISPGAGTKFLKDGDTMNSRDPVMMTKVFEKLGNLTDSVDVIVTRLKNGEGTIGKLLTDEAVYKNLEAFTEDIKNNPWKLLNKPRGQ
jgi:phospholipid/cholesterol/gamma-HCH transport system substrate-binding protein